MALELSATTNLLFIGDSITDCGQREDPERIGNGYVRFIRDGLRALNPAIAPNVINRGINADRVTDLADRWQRDVLDLAPDVLSIQIGINDVLKNIDGRNQGTDIERYVRVYDNLLAQVGTLLPDCQIVLSDPGVIWPPQPVEAGEQLAAYVAAVRELAANRGVIAVVPLRDEFENAKASRPEIDWVPDGVHPSSSGHMLIALTWLRATGVLV